MKLTRKQIKANRLWKHWLYWLGDAVPFGPDLKPIPNYNPEQWRSAFERYQTLGSGGISSEALWHIAPLIAAQRSKEVFLTSLAQESLEFWASGFGWSAPWYHTLECGRSDARRMDRLTRVAILRTMRSIKADPVGFFSRHPGIKQHTKERYFALFLDTTTNRA